MKNVYRVAHLAAMALLGSTSLIQGMEPVRRTKTVTIGPSAPQAMPVIVRQMVIDLPILNAKVPSDRYNIIHSYFQRYAGTLLSISAFIQSGVFRPGAELADVIRNRRIIRVSEDDFGDDLISESPDILGDYLYQIAKLHGHNTTMAWLVAQGLANPQNNFFQRMFQISLNRDNFQPADAALWLTLGAQVDAQDAQGMTALMRRAQTQGETGIEQMKFLLEHGANPNLQNRDGNTALHLASPKEDTATLHNGRPSVAKTKLLLDHGARTDILNKAGKRP